MPHRSRDLGSILSFVCCRRVFEGFLESVSVRERDRERDHHHHDQYPEDKCVEK